MPNKRGHQPRGLGVGDRGKFIVTLSTYTADQGQVIEAFAQWAASDDSPVGEAGKVVTWGKVGSGGSFNHATSSTDAVGVARIQFTVGSIVGATYTITASGTNGVTGASSTLTVTSDLIPASITVTPATLRLSVGQTGQLTAVVKNASGTVLSNSVAWSSSAEAQATVASGLVTAVATGSATVLARINDLASNSVSVTVTVATAPATITLAPTSVTLEPGEPRQIAAVVKNADGDVVSSAGLVWATTDSSIASVSQTGVVTGGAVGSASVTASLGGITSNTLAVTSTAASDVELPRVYLDTAMSDTPATGATISVASGGNLQAALNAAQLGNTIELAAGAVFSGNYAFGPKTTGNAGEWIIVKSAGSLPAEGTRMTSALAVSNNIPKIRTPNTAPMLITNGAANNWRFIGIEFDVDPSVAPGVLGTGVRLINLGDNTIAQNTLAKSPTDLIIDRCWVHGNATLDCRNGIQLNSARTAIIDSTIDEIHSTFDAVAIGGSNGPGPFKIVNNSVSSSGENIAFGGADPGIPNLVSADIEIRGNYVWKDPAWKLTSWVEKNFIESKNSTRVDVNGNVLDYSWVSGQVGYTLVLWSANQDGSANWSETSHWTFRNNVIRHASAGVTMTSGVGLYGGTFVPMHHVAVRNNVWINLTNEYGRIFQLDAWVAHVKIEHNTAFSPNNAIFVVANTGTLPGQIIRNNLFGSAVGYGLIGTAWADFGSGIGSTAANNVLQGVSSGSNAFPDSFYPATITDVALVGGPTAPFSDATPLADMALTGGSPYHHAGTDGADIGADMTVIAAAVAGVGGGF